MSSPVVTLPVCVRVRDLLALLNSKAQHHHGFPVLMPKAFHMRQKKVGPKVFSTPLACPACMRLIGCFTWL
jgi:hypothetical protein